MAQNRRRSSGSGLTPKQKQAALVLGICALVLIITISVVAVIVSKAGKNPDSSSSGPASGSTSTPAVENNFNPGQYGDAVLGETDDAGKSYIEETIFVGDSNTSRYYQNGLLDLDHVVALDGLGIQQLTSQKDIYFKGDDTGYSIPEALAKMKPRRIIVMMGTNNTDGSMSASDFASNYKSALQAIQSAYSYCDIIVAAVPPIPQAHAQYPNVSMSTINGFNEALAQMCSESGYKFLNITEVLLGSDGYGKANYYQTDDVHLRKDGLTAIMDYARTHAYLGTEDRRPDPANTPPRRKGGGDGTAVPTTKPDDDEKTYTAQYNVDQKGGTLESGDQKGVTSLTFKDVKSTASITVTAKPNDGYEFVKWSDGSTNATRTDKDFKQNINVTAVFSTKLTMKIKEGSSGTITLGDTQYLHIELSDKSVNTDGVIWTLDGTEFKRGVSCGVSPEKEGTFTVKASLTTGGKTYTVEYKLTVKAGVVNPTGITVNGGGSVPASGGEYTLTATVTPSNAQGTVGWSVSGEGAVLSANSGSSTKVTIPSNSGTNARNYTVTAKIGDKTASVTFTQEGAPDRDMNASISASSNSIKVGETATITVSDAPSGASYSWEGVTGTNSSATFTGSTVGTVEIKVTITAQGYNSKTLSVTITVVAGDTPTDPGVDS